MPHVILLSPESPAGQRRFVRGLKRAGARVTGVGSAAPEQLDPEVRHLLDEYERVPSLTDEAEVEAAVRRIQLRGPWVHHLEATTAALVGVAARLRARTAIPGLSEEQARLCQDKQLVKSFLRERGIPCAYNEGVASALAAAAFVDRVGYPVILKPKVGGDRRKIWRIDDPEALDRAVAESGLAEGAEGFVMEEFVVGHEGYYDALVCDGVVVFEAVSHHYPPVLEAMRTRWLSAQIVHTNRIEQDGYDALRSLGRQVIGDLGLQTTAVHLEWFSGPRGLWFSEIAAAPPSDDYWELYGEASEIDLYAEWARAVVHGRVDLRPGRRFAAGLVNLRPDRDGIVAGYEGVEQMQRRYGELIFRMHLPPPGTPTQPIEAGYLANAWVCVKHPDYDALREILDDIGRTVRLLAR